MNEDQCGQCGMHMRDAATCFLHEQVHSEYTRWRPGIATNTMLGQLPDVLYPRIAQLMQDYAAQAVLHALKEDEAAIGVEDDARRQRLGIQDDTP